MDANKNGTMKTTVSKDGRAVTVTGTRFSSDAERAAAEATGLSVEEVRRKSVAFFVHDGVPTFIIGVR